jgi:lysophospholipase L1-like esterase
MVRNRGDGACRFCFSHFRRKQCARTATIKPARRSVKPMRLCIILAALLVLAPFDAALAQLADTGNFHIRWEVKNRFRLFRREADFLHQVAASRGDGVLAQERRLETAADGEGWAKDVVANLCVDDFGNLLQTCNRDGVSESYLTPRDHPISVAISGPVPQGAICAWSFDDGSGPLRQMNAPCGSELRLRVPYGHTTVATVDIPLGDGTAQRVVTEIAVRDLLIAGLGDSIAAGEGDPDQAVQLEGAFCFRRFGGGQYYRPSRAGFEGDHSCENGTASDAAAQDWARHGARWMSPACHRSLYSYQVRTALALAVEQPHVAVTFLPLACTGASIEAGMFGGQSFDDCPTMVQFDSCGGTAPAQFTELKDLMDRVHKLEPQRKLDMILLTVGANDINFASLVANVIVQASTERLILGRGGGIVDVQDSEAALLRRLPQQFARLRAALKPFVGGNLARVVFVSYPNPAMQAPGKSCPGGRDGLDIHPAFSADAERLRTAAEFVDQKFLPALKALATCDGAQICSDPLTDRMTFVDSYQAEFERHGMCVHAPTDPEFDRKCFSPDGNSFRTDLVAAAQEPMACGLPASDYQPYASRARWIRTANDSYFTAMTYPQGIPATLRPSDIHDALWGVLSAVYGGAVHPTAEGYAAIADAALPAARVVLDLPQPPTVSAEPLPPVQAPPPGVAPTTAPVAPAGPATAPAAPAPAPPASASSPTP